MPAETLNCPMCGAAASSDASRCEHCGARLATVACPSCFGMIFQGAKFCSHCGARVDRAEEPDGKPKPCPRCRLNMESVLIGDCHLKECPRCEGLWVDAPTLNQICTDREKQSAILGVAITLEDKPGQLEPVRYLPCPICKEFMNRVNFANCSHVIVDVCKPHGTWFDKDELRRIVEFIRGGGFDKARAIQIQQWQDERHRLESARSAPPPPDISSGVDFHLSDRHLGVSIAAAVLSSIFD